MNIRTLLPILSLLMLCACLLPKKSEMLPYPDRSKFKFIYAPYTADAMRAIEVANDRLLKDDMDVGNFKVEVFESPELFLVSYQIDQRDDAKADQYILGGGYEVTVRKNDFQVETVWVNQ